MKTDVDGRSTCLLDQECFEKFYSCHAPVERHQYDYRHPSGLLFSTVATTLDECRQKRDAWLKQHGLTLEIN